MAVYTPAVCSHRSPYFHPLAIATISSPRSNQSLNIFACARAWQLLSSCVIYYLCGAILQFIATFHEGQWFVFTNPKPDAKWSTTVRSYYISWACISWAVAVFY